MARKTGIRERKEAIPVLIGAGLTERWYFKHIKVLLNLKVKISPRYFGSETISSLEKKIEEVISGDGSVIVVFDADVSVWNESERKKLVELRKKYSKNKRVILCESMPSIEFWFLLHYVNTNRQFGTSKAVIGELVKHIANYAKGEGFLEKSKWVEEMSTGGKLETACERALRFGTSGESYSEVWKAFEYLGYFKP